MKNEQTSPKKIGQKKIIVVKTSSALQSCRDKSQQNQNYDKVKDIFNTIYEEYFNEILLNLKEKFIQKIVGKCEYILLKNFTDRELKSKSMNNIINNVKEEIETRYTKDYDIIGNFYKKYKIKSRDLKIDYVKKFRKHCFKGEGYAYHFCRDKSKIKKRIGKFILIKNIDDENVQFVMCEECNSVYYSNYIQMYCSECNEEFYSNILNTEDDENLQLSTWEKYHCNNVRNEIMKCVKCRKYLYINIKTRKLVCLNKDCNFTSEPKNIIWNCSNCNQEFKSEAKIYNPLDIQCMRKAIHLALLQKDKQRPPELPCCKEYNGKIDELTFYHKKECQGEIYKGELCGKAIIVCGKCNALNFYEKFTWTCPICGKKFHLHNLISVRPFCKKKYVINQDYTSNLLSQNPNRSVRGGSISDYSKINQTTKNIQKIINYLNTNSTTNKTKIEIRNNDKFLESEKNLIFAMKNKGMSSSIENDSHHYFNKYIFRNKKKYTSAFETIDKVSNSKLFKSTDHFKINQTESSDKNNKKLDNQKEKSTFKGSKIGNSTADDSSLVTYSSKENTNKILTGNSCIYQYNKNCSNMSKYSKYKHMKKFQPDCINNLNSNPCKNKSVNYLTGSLENEIFNLKKSIKNSDLNMSFSDIRKIDNSENSKEKELPSSIDKIQVKQIRYKKYLKKKNGDEKGLITQLKYDKQKRLSFQNFKEKEKNENEIDDLIDKYGVISDKNIIKININYNRIEDFKKIEKNIKNETKTNNPNNSNLLFKSMYRVKKEENKQKNEKGDDNKKLNLIKKNNDTSSIKIFEKNKNKEENEEKKIEKNEDVDFMVSPQLVENINKNCIIPQFEDKNYKYIRPIGQGSYGVIYLVESLENNKQFALKKIICSNNDEVAKHVKQLELIYKISHENIMKVYNIQVKCLDETIYCIYILMERAQNDWSIDIKRRMVRKKYYKESEIINILKQLTKGLSFLQDKSIAHRDIKPQNILIYNNNIYKIADLGEAKEMVDNSKLITLRGSELYMSPLLYNGLNNRETKINHNPYKSDVYSLGLCVIYAMSLSLNLLDSIRELKDFNLIKNKIEEAIPKHFYSDELKNLVFRMVELDENKRFDFNQLNKEISSKF